MELFNRKMLFICFLAVLQIACAAIIFLTQSTYLKDVFPGNKQLSMHDNANDWTTLADPDKHRTHVDQRFCDTEYLNDKVFNNTVLLVWPRIPKTAGTNFLDLLSRFNKLNNVSYRYLTDSPHFAYAAYKSPVRPGNIDYQNPVEFWSDELPTKGMNEQNMNKLMALELNMSAPKHLPVLPLFHGHLIFIPFLDANYRNILFRNPSKYPADNHLYALFNAGRIKYMSMIRDPLQRIVSSYLYIRGQSGGWRGSSKGYKQTIDAIMNATKNSTFDECVVDYVYGSNICAFSSNYLVGWFCGYDIEICNRSNLTKLSLDRAIYNINKYFSYIGVSEYFDESIKWFFRKFPQYILQNEKYIRRNDENCLFTDCSFQFNNIFWTDFKNETDKLNAKRQNHGYNSQKHNSTQNKTIMNLLYQKNELDVELYRYVVDRFKRCIMNE